jgi:hypothetical protein
VERRIRKIQKWLDRCLEACKARSWENALADMECANAELSRAREQLWHDLSANLCEDRRGIGKYLPSWTRTSLVAAVVILASAVPLAVNEVVVSRETARSNSELVLEWVGRDEQKLLAALRESLSENSFREVQNVPEKAEFDNAPSEALVVSRKRSETSAPSEVAQEVEEGSGVSAESGEKEAEVSLEEVIALVQIGERSLRDQGSAIEIRN